MAAEEASGDGKKKNPTHQGAANSAETTARGHPLAVSGSPAQTAQKRREIDGIVRRLEAIVVNHLEGARRVGNPLRLEQIIAIVEALQAEAQGQAWPARFSDGEVTFYLMDGLYEELLEEPSNIFSATPVVGGGTRFEPLQRGFWLACLDALQARLKQMVL